MKILFLGDYSNYHRCLAEALRRMGHDVTVVSNGSRWLNTHRDIDVSRKGGGRIGGLLLWLKLQLLSHRFTGYDVVQINSPTFVDLRPEKVRRLFDFLKRNNRSVFMTAMGNDTPFVKMCIENDSPLRYNEWQIDGAPGPHRVESPMSLDSWLQPSIAAHCDYIYEQVDGVLTALYEYHLSCRRIVPRERLAYAGIPIDASTLKVEVERNVPRKLKLFLGMHRDRQVEKGTDRLLAAARRVVEEYPEECELEVVENVPYDEYLSLMCYSHVILDQLYSYTPATNALLAMAQGLTAVTGGEAEYYDFIGEKELRPIVNAEPDDERLYESLKELVLNKERVIENIDANREFVRRHNDAQVVAQRFLDFWQKRLKELQR